VTKAHAALISLLLGTAVVLGMFAALRTTSLAAEPSSAGAPAIAARQERLNRVEAQLQRALEGRPPALPAARAASPGVAPRVAYVRAAPIPVARASYEQHGEEDEEYEEYEEDSDD
jgi:hypothetical protein